MKFFIVLAFASVIGSISAGSGSKELNQDLDTALKDIRVDRLVNVNDCSQRFSSRARTYSAEYQQFRTRQTTQYESFVINEALGIEMNTDSIFFSSSLESQFSEAAVRIYIVAEFARVQMTYINSIQNDITVWRASARRNKKALQCWRTESRKFVKQMIITIRTRIQESIDRNVDYLDERIENFRSTVNEKAETWDNGASKKCGKKGGSGETKGSGEKRETKTAKRRQCKVGYVSR
jgi:hypothetical protein